jgi:hypothetical protein
MDRYAIIELIPNGFIILDSFTGKKYKVEGKIIEI